MIKVAVVIPLYNQGVYLFDCLTSVFNQTVKPVSVMVIDDKSTDSSLMIANTIQKDFINDGKLFIIEAHDVNKGVSEARNTGIKALKTESIDFVICLDADDKLPTGYIEELSKVAVATDADVIYTDCCIFNERGFQGISAFPNYQELGMRTRNLVHSASMFRLSKAIESGLFPADFKEGFEDYAFFLKMAMNGARFIKCGKTFLYYRRPLNKVTRNTQATTVHRYAIRDRLKAVFQGYYLGW